MERRHSDLVEGALVADVFTAIGGPDVAHGEGVVGELRGRVLEGHRETAFEHALDLRAEPQQEAAARQFVEVPRLHGGDRWRARERKRDRRSDPDAPCRADGSRSLDERRPRQLGRPDGLEPGFLGRPREVCHVRDGPADAEPELHRCRLSARRSSGSTVRSSSATCCSTLSMSTMTLARNRSS